MSIAIDTLKTTKQLQASGFSGQQAEAVTEVLKEVQDLNLEQLVTKEDLLATEKELQYEIKELKLEINSQLLLLKWMLGLLLAGVISLIMKTFFI